MIYQIKRNNVVIFEHEIRGSRTKSAPAVDYIDIEFDYYQAILLKRNDTIVFKGQTYYCDKQYSNTQKKSTNLYTHRARFLSENYRATEIAVLDAQNVSEFEIEGNLLTLITLAVTNLNRVSSGWSYETPVPNTITRKFVISEENVMSFLVKVSGEFEIPFDITNKVIKFAEPTHVNAGNFAYGKGNGFLDLTKTYRSGEKVPNTIYANGGNDLVLDDPIINVENISENGIIEGFYSNENIVATTRVQMVGTVTANNVVPTNQINYNINAYKIAGQIPLINFETGALAGLSFYMTEFDYNGFGNTSLIYLKRRTVDGVLLPSDTVRAESGDYFNITNITQSEEVINEAKQKLFDYAFSYMQNGINKNLIVNASLDPLFDEDLNLNNKITIIDDNLDLNGDFVINEIKEDLQNLNKKDIKLDIVGFLGFNFNLPIKNENIIELEIQDNFDELVRVEEELVRVEDELGYVKGDVDDIRTDTNILELEVSDIITVKLPSKESINNKVTDLKDLNTDLYPNVQAVVDGLEETLTTANAYTDSAVEGLVYDVTYNSGTHTITFFFQDKPNLVIDLPIEQLIKGVEVVGNDLVFTFEDGSTTTVPMNTLLVGVVKKVNGLVPNSLGEVVLQITDIPSLSSALDNKVSKTGDSMSDRITMSAQGQYTNNIHRDFRGAGNGDFVRGIVNVIADNNQLQLATYVTSQNVENLYIANSDLSSSGIEFNRNGTVSVNSGTANNHAVNLGQLPFVELNYTIGFVHMLENNSVANEVYYNNEAPLNIQFQDTETVKITATTDGVNTKYRFDSNASLITHDAPLDGYLAGGGNNAVKVICHIMNENIFQSPTDGNVLVNDAISLVGLWDDYRDKAVLRGEVQVNTSLQSYINAGKRYLVYYGEINSLGTQIDYQDCNFYTLIEIANMKLAVGEKNFIVKVGEIMNENTIYVNTDLM